MSDNETILNNEESNNLNDSTYEFSNFLDSLSMSSLENYFNCNITSIFSVDEIKNILLDPIANHEQTRRLSRFVYNSEGVVTNSIDYMTALPCLDRVIYGDKKLFGKKKSKKNRDLMLATLNAINDKKFIRDALFTDMIDGTCFYYFDVRNKKEVDRNKYLKDYDIESISEINEIGINASITPLPYDYCKIIGRRNGRNVVAFNLRYFDDKCHTQEDKDRKLKKYPSEIRDAYTSFNKGKITSNWLVLNNDHTIAHKIKCKTSEPWGRPLAIAAISDILYQNEFTDTKRNVLRELNNKIIYQTLPEGRDKGSCSLTKKQQEDQHSKVKGAVLNKNNRGGTSFFTVAAGTKINSLDIGTSDIFDEKNESNLTDKIALDLGVASSLLNGSGSGNYSSQQNNLELINSQIYTWVQELQDELNHVINECIIKDKNNKAYVYYLPTSLVNRKNFFEMCKSLYLETGGSMTFLIASTGISPEVYYSVLDDEIENGVFDKYQPHKTSYTMSANDNVGGRPTTDNPADNTITTRTNNGNGQPKPSTK